MLFEGASPLRHSQVRKMQIKLNPLHVQAKQNSNTAVGQICDEMNSQEN